MRASGQADPHLRSRRGGVQKDLDPPGALPGGPLEAAIRLQIREDRLDVFAGTQAVDPMIGAAAGVEVVRERADLDVIGAAALGTDPEGAEQPLPRLEGLDRDGLLERPPAPLFDLLGIGGAPALKTGLRDDLLRPDPSLPCH